MYNYKAKVVRPVTVKNKEWFAAGAEVDVLAPYQGAEEVCIMLSKYAKIATLAADLEEIEGTGYVTQE